MTEFYVLGFESWGEPHVSGPYATIEEAAEALEDSNAGHSFIVQRLT